jgi:hypothetical protein
MPPTDSVLLEHAQQRVPQDEGVRDCWKFIIQGIKVGWLSRSEIREVVGHLSRHEDYGLDELLFEEVDERLRISFLDDWAECSPAAMIDELRELLQSAGG